ncbi:MAG: hypothetical protein MHPSP_004544, partial [Paramarteilia canceri]
IIIKYITDKNVSLNQLRKFFDDQINYSEELDESQFEKLYKYFIEVDHREDHDSQIFQQMNFFFEMLDSQNKSLIYTEDLIKLATDLDFNVSKKELEDMFNMIKRNDEPYITRFQFIDFFVKNKLK